MPQQAPRHRALIVEDEVAIRELLRLHLDLGGFALEETGDGRQALDMARTTHFDLRHGGAQLILPVVEDGAGFTATYGMAMRPGA